MEVTVANGDHAVTDPIKLALWLGLAALLIGVVSLGSVAWANSASRNLVLAVSTLFAAVLLFVMQLQFELRSKEELDVFTSELTVDRDTPMIRQWRYPDANAASWRLTAETVASNFIAKKEPARFSSDPTRLGTDLILYSFIQYLGIEQFDWQVRRTALQGFTFGTEIRSAGISSGADCTAFSQSDLQAILKTAGSPFAGLPLSLVGGRLCLPPGSTIRMSTTGLEIRTPYCTVSFVVEPSQSVSYAEPGSQGQVPQARSGGPRFETRLTAIRSTVKYSWVRAQSRDMEKYVQWAQRVVNGARLWFEGRSDHTS